LRFATPDQALRATWETFQQCSNVQAMNPVAQEGTRFAKICAQCKSGPYRVKHDRDGLPFALCRHCGKDRHREDVFLLRESGGGGGDFARPLDRLADLELVVDRCYATGGAFRAYAVDRARPASSPIEPFAERSETAAPASLASSTSPTCSRRTSSTGSEPARAMAGASHSHMPEPTPAQFAQYAQPVVTEFLCVLCVLCGLR
jgi:hypothetical protein